MSAIGHLARRLAGATFAQAARVAELAARRSGHAGEVGRDTYPADEPVRFVASDRLSLPAGDVAEVDAEADQVRISANVLGLAGATPALPPIYSELQLQRRRLRDSALAQFLNLFDHRALSFFYRIARKYSWPLQVEGTRGDEREPIGAVALALAGIGVGGTRHRLAADDAVLAPLAAHLGDARRSAASVETVLRLLTGLPLRISQAEAVWMAVPAQEQTRLGGPDGRFTRLGGSPSPLAQSEAAMIGSAVLEAQHHYVIEIGPVSYRQLQLFCTGSEVQQVLGDLCTFAAGIEHQPSIRMLIDARDIPPLRLGAEDAPALLGWTSWLEPTPGSRGIVTDCVIPVRRPLGAN
ncbi:type VI secretion system baseplate subunit TssG [Sphingomonas parva]|uniref:Type VI secretion system baseplate subunit TssG n=1 Tax=Sphingomonas parva TaxID=2555898 RepID=A0A4Y8ZNM3_9SPHN|nr:type VI secretion system baseplate subunit TssG [Sphingomonas parva]TFI57608.1 type VI secretion system baseplate subunit TssG [Sphingomonas parva]